MEGHTQMVTTALLFPVVEETTSVSCRVTCDRLSTIFETHGILKRLETDNETPFNSAEFKEFAEEMGFQHQGTLEQTEKQEGSWKF